MRRTRPPAEQTATLLLALAEASTAWRHAYELCVIANGAVLIAEIEQYRARHGEYPALLL
jgi:hypothetical protein